MIYSNTILTKKNKKPWPTKDAMEQVYEMKLWGGSEYDFYSGEGSHKPEIVKPYLAVVVDFLRPFNKNITVCDLGCGDFNVGKELLPYTDKYIAVDIVESLIKRNKTKYNEANLEFYCLDIAKDDLPEADCVIVRQVLQHLSNDEVKKVLLKINKYEYLILTEHIPNGDFELNKDIISGQGTRLKKESGLDIVKPPFNFKTKETKELLRVELPKNKGVIITTLYIT